MPTVVFGETVGQARRWKTYP